MSNFIDIFGTRVSWLYLQVQIQIPRLFPWVEMHVAFDDAVDLSGRDARKNGGLVLAGWLGFGGMVIAVWNMSQRGSIMPDTKRMIRHVMVNGFCWE